MADVARVAGVSKMTVSNVINNKAAMSGETRQRVRRAIEETGYVVNPAARVLAGGRMNIIGVIVPRLNWPYVTEIIQSASAAAEAAGFDLAIFTTADDARIGRERAQLLRTLADGVLLVIPSAGEHQVFQNAVPVVTLGGPGPYTVETDNQAGGRLAAQHLIDLGHRRIAHVRGLISDLRGDAGQRLQGFHDALRGAGLAVPAAYLQDGAFTEEGGEQAAERLLRLSTPPSAIFAANDRSAIGVLKAAARLGVRVPHDLSVVGFDDIHAATLTDPPLTTVRQPLERMGEAAAQMLIGLMRQTAPPDPHVHFPASLIVRGTTGSPRPLRRKAGRGAS
nr:LacI family DNA-binding transcriptional regulator [Deinococcus budaensis]